MVYCAVKYCPFFKLRKNEDNGSHKCHSFPKDESHRVKWEAWVNKVHVMGQFKSSKSSGLCSAHFAESCFTEKKRLFKNAEPSIAPKLTADIALRLGIISQVSDFPLLCSTTSPGPSVDTVAVSEDETGGTEALLDGNNDVEMAHMNVKPGNAAAIERDQDIPQNDVEMPDVNALLDGDDPDGICDIPSPAFSLMSNLMDCTEYFESHDSVLIPGPLMTADLSSPAKSVQTTKSVQTDQWNGESSCCPLCGHDSRSAKKRKVRRDSADEENSPPSNYDMGTRLSGSEIVESPRTPRVMLNPRKRVDIGASMTHENLNLTSTSMSDRDDGVNVLSEEHSSKRTALSSIGNVQQSPRTPRVMKPANRVDSGTPMTPKTLNLTCTSNSNLGNRVISDRSAEPSCTSGTPLFSSGSFESLSTPRPKRNGKRKYFIGDMSPRDFKSPGSAKRSLDLIKARFYSSQSDRKILRQRLRRSLKKIKSLKDLLTHLKEQNKVSPELANLIQDRFSGPQSEMLAAVLKGKVGKQYGEVLRQFAMTLNFHSPAAYDYVRNRLLKKSLPHPKTLARWYGAVDAEPGFTKESFTAIQVEATRLKTDHKKDLYLALMCDEMAIRKNVQYLSNGTVAGYVNDGSGSTISDSSPAASQAWVFMAVAINASWKIPVGYFFIDSLDAASRSNVIKNCLQFLSDTGARVVSLTMDGTSTNLSSVEMLGAGMQPEHNWHPYFKHPVTNENVYVFLDAAHMAKLWRNILGNKSVHLKDSRGRSIVFDFIRRLHALQEEEGLRAGNKLTKRHVNYVKEKMRVYLATQTLSTSVADALDTCREDWRLPNFQGSEGTTNFLRVANDTFDILNSTNPRSKTHLRRALAKDNIAEVRARMEEVRNYILGLQVKSDKGVHYRSVLDSPSKTWFLGFLCDLYSFEALYNELVETDKLFLPAYKFSQDHVEMFFSSIRSRGGWNNNPSTVHFKSAYKRLLVHTQLKEGKKGGNCFPLELVSVLHVSPKSPRAEKAAEEDARLVISYDHCYSRVSQESVSQESIQLSTFVGDVVAYISGFVVRKVAAEHGCDTCASALIKDPSQEETCPLLRRKDRGGLIHPSSDVVAICQKAERIIRAEAKNKIFLTTKLDFHVSRVFREVVSLNRNLFESLDDHIAGQAFLENHRTTLIRLIIRKYLIVRLCYDLKTLNNVFAEERCRTMNNKLTIFRGQ